ncbi:hypothetical protein Tco_1519234, partial [Tanacetum coccineum]
MSTLVFVDPEISTQADEAQSSRVPVPLPEDPYEAIRQAYLDRTDIKTARMAVRVPPAMSSGLSASMAEVAAMSESIFLEDAKEDDDQEDEEIEESLDSDSVTEDAEDEGPTVEDEDPTAGDEGLPAEDEGPGIGVESCGSDDKSRGLDDEGHSVESDGLGLREEEEAIAEDPEDGMVYIDVPAYPPPAPPVQTSPSPEWTSGSLHISPSPSIVLSPILSPMILLTVPSPVATPATVETEGFLTELGAQVEMQRGLIRDHGGENQELRLQLAEERRARLELAKIIDSMRRGQEP